MVQCLFKVLANSSTQLIAFLFLQIRATLNLFWQRTWFFLHLSPIPWLSTKPSSLLLHSLFQNLLPGGENVSYTYRGRPQDIVNLHVTIIGLGSCHLWPISFQKHPQVLIPKFLSLPHYFELNLKHHNISSINTSVSATGKGSFKKYTTTILQSHLG